MTIATLALAAAVVVGLALIPVGLPGLWLILLAGVAHRVLVDPPTLSWWLLGGCAALALVGEFLEFRTSARYTEKVGGSKRAGWGAVIGGISGAIIGVPVPIVGSVVGAFGGAYLGALAGEYSHARDLARARQVAAGALVGRGVATVQKVLVGLVIGIVLVGGAWG